MERLKHDDDKAFVLLLERHWSPLLTYLMPLVGAPDLAEDVAQEAFIALWEVRKRWKPNGSVRAYLYRTAHNLGLGTLRQVEERRGAPSSAASTLPSRDRSPLEYADQQEQREALLKAVESLAARRREAVILVRLKGYSLEEAAERMKVSRQTVSNHVSLAIKNLSVLLSRFRR